MSSTFTGELLLALFGKHDGVAFGASDPFSSNRSLLPPRRERRCSLRVIARDPCRPCALGSVDPDSLEFEFELEFPSVNERVKHSWGSTRVAGGVVPYDVCNVVPLAFMGTCTKSAGICCTHDCVITGMP